HVPDPKQFWEKVVFRTFDVQDQTPAQRLRQGNDRGAEQSTDCSLRGLGHLADAKNPRLDRRQAFRIVVAGEQSHLRPQWLAGLAKLGSLQRKGTRDSRKTGAAVDGSQAARGKALTVLSHQCDILPVVSDIDIMAP